MKNCINKVMKSAYSFLIRFVRNNKVNKRWVFKYIDTLFKEHKGTGLGSTQLVGEVLRDDPSLLNKRYSDFKEKVDVIELTPLSSLQKSTNLYYLSVYMKFRDDIILENQIDVITELTQKDNQNTIYLFENDESRVELSVIINDLYESIMKQLKKSKSSTAEVEIPSHLSYVTQLLNVMAVATSGKNAITEIICQGLLPLSELIKCYEEGKFIYTYKIQLIQFYIDTYLEIEKDVPNDLQDSIIQLLGLIGDDFDRYLTKGGCGYFEDDTLSVKDSTFQNIDDRIVIKSLFGKNTLSKLQTTFIYETALSWLENIYQLRMRIKAEHEQVFVIMLKKIEQLQELTNNYDYSQKVNHIIDIAKKNPQFRNVRKRLLGEDSKLEEDFSPYGNAMIAAKSIINPISKKKKSSVNRIGERFLDANVDVSPRTTFLSKNSTAAKLSSYLQDLLDSEEFEDKIENEFEQLAKSIINLKKKSTIGFSKVCTLEPRDVIEAIVDLTDLDGIQLTLDQVPTALKLLRKIIEVENPDTMKPAAEWTGEQDDPTPEIIRNQNLLASCDGCLLVANLIKYEKDEAITYEAFLLGIAMLIGGNHEVQMKFWEYMIDDIENKFLEVVFESLK